MFFCFIKLITLSWCLFLLLLWSLLMKKERKKETRKVFLFDNRGEPCGCWVYKKIVSYDFRSRLSWKLYEEEIENHFCTEVCVRDFLLTLFFVVCYFFCCSLVKHRIILCIKHKETCVLFESVSRFRDRSTSHAAISQSFMFPWTLFDGERMNNMASYFFIQRSFNL